MSTRAPHVLAVAITVVLFSTAGCGGGGGYTGYRGYHGPSPWRHHYRETIIVVPPDGVDIPEAVPLPEPPPEIPDIPDMPDMGMPDVYF